MADEIKQRKSTLSSTEKAMKIVAIAVDAAAAKIASSAASAVVEIHNAANIATDKIAIDVSNAKKVVADDAATALRVSNTTTNIDHDLITELGVSLKVVVQTISDLKIDLKADIKEIKDGTALKIEKNRVDIEQIAFKMPGLCTDVSDLKIAVYEKLEDRFRKIENKVSNFMITIALAGTLMTSMIGLIIWHILHTT